MLQSTDEYFVQDSLTAKRSPFIWWRTEHLKVNVLSQICGKHQRQSQQMSSERRFAKFRYNKHMCLKLKYDSVCSV